LGNHGFEIELVGGITPDLSIIATYSDLKMRDSLGRHVRAVADKTSSLMINYRVRQGGFEGLSLFAGVNYSGRRAGDTPVNYMPAPFNNVIGQVSFYLKPYYATTVGGSYRLNEKFMFRVIIDNVLDEKGYIQQAGGRVSGTGITTAPGTNIRFQTTYNF
jgi:iron complex outermembrane receptor protein